MAINFNPGAGRGRIKGGKANARVVGLERLQKEFKQMGAKADSKVTREVHRAAQRIAERANREVPIDSGELQGSINVKKWVRAASVRVDATYAGFVELGTRYMKAQPYILKHVKPSIDTMMKSLKAII